MSECSNKVVFFCSDSVSERSSAAGHLTGLYLGYRSLHSVFGSRALGFSNPYCQLTCLSVDFVILSFCPQFFFRMHLLWQFLS